MHIDFKLPKLTSGGERIVHAGPAASEHRTRVDTPEPPTRLARIWHAWTHAAKADAYENLMRTKVIPAITARAADGYRGIELLRRDLGAGEVEFVTIMYFDHADAVRVFTGTDIDWAVVPREAQQLLTRFYEVARHYEVRASG